MTNQEFLKLDNKEYIGDGVYVGHDGYHLWLCTYNGYNVTNAVALEPNVLHSLRVYLQADTLAGFARRGQAAQKAVEEILEEHKTKAEDTSA